MWAAGSILASFRQNYKLGGRGTRKHCGQQEQGAILASLQQGCNLGGRGAGGQ